MDWLLILIFFLIFKIDSQIHTQKIKLIFFILNYLYRNLQEILKILKLKLKLKYSKSLKLKPKLKPLSIFGLWVRII